MKQWQVEHYKKQYPAGARIKLIHMEDSYAPVPDGTTGIVVMVDDAGNIHMNWDNGRSLAICPEVDSFTKIGGE